jgi:quinol monooxygenase YgiN
MIEKALFVRVEAKPGKEDEVEAFLKGALADVQEESGTVDWFALKFGHSTFAIFDTFEGDGARPAHLAGKVGRALIAKTPVLLAEMPKIENAEVLAAKPLH